MAGHRHMIFATALILAPGCYQGADEAADITTTRSVQFNNVALQGINLQGINLQGINLQGINLQGTEFSGAMVVDGKLVARSGEDMIGAEWSLRVSGVNDKGKPVVEYFVLRFDDIYLDPNYDDVYLYEISYRPKLDNTWKPICADGQGNALPAIPLSNYWDAKTGDRIDDPDVVTFSCTNAVLAKCVEWGYRPWATATRCKDFKKDKHCYEVSLEDYHQACTRMARADYCGNGEPWTVPGTAIDIWDHLSPQIEAPATEWAIEAEWTPEGAYCLNDIRQQGWKQQGLYPKCFTDKKGKPEKGKKDCGSLKKHRALLVSAFNKYGEPMP